MGMTYVEKVGEKDVRLIFRDAVDAPGEAFVHKDTLPARDRCGCKQLFEIILGADVRLVRITGCTASSAEP